MQASVEDLFHQLSYDAADFPSAVWMLAVLAVATVRTLRDYFQRGTMAAKKKMHENVAFGRRLLSVIYAVLKTGRPMRALG